MRSEKMPRSRKFKCPFCRGLIEISGEDYSCPHCKAGESGLTEGQVIELRKGMKRSTRVGAVILLISGASFIIGIAGVFVNVIMGILGFVFWAISLGIVLLLMSRGRYLSIILALWGKEYDQGKALDQN